MTYTHKPHTHTYIHIYAPMYTPTHTHTHTQYYTYLTPQLPIDNQRP